MSSAASRRGSKVKAEAKAAVSGPFRGEPSQLDRFGEDQVEFVVDAAESFPFLGEAPPNDVTPPLEQSHQASEGSHDARWERVGPAFPRHERLFQSPRFMSGGEMGCEFLVILRIGGRCEYLTVTRSEIEEDGGDAVPVGGIAGPERARQFDPTDPCHRCRETLGSQPPQFGVCGDREQPRALPGTRAATATRTMPPGSSHSRTSPAVVKVANSIAARWRFWGGMSTTDHTSTTGCSASARNTERRERSSWRSTARALRRRWSAYSANEAASSSSALFRSYLATRFTAML